MKIWPKLATLFKNADSDQYSLAAPQPYKIPDKKEFNKHELSSGPKMNSGRFP